MSSSSDYNSIHHGAHSKKKGASSSNDIIQQDSEVERPHLYSRPVVSAPLITWYGLPTVIEFEQPAATTSPNAAIAEEAAEFASINGGRSRLNNKFSRSAYSTRAGKEGQQPRQSKSLFFGASSATDTNDNEQCISAYTFRVRSMAKPSLDEHRLRLRQNLDGTYSHVESSEAAAVATMSSPNGHFTIDDDVPDSDTGLLMMPPRGENHKASISLDTVMNVETTLGYMENKELPPHAHPSLPDEILQPEHTRTAPPLKLWPLAVLVFYNVSGGPFGIEPSIRAAGNFYAILGFIIFPFIWAIPEALVTAELGAAFQDPSAGLAWVEHAFGERMGGLNGYFGWLSGALDNAIYPTLFIEYVSSVAGWGKDEFGFLARFCSIVTITVGLAFLNYTGLEIVGNASLVICIIAMSPFVIMTIIGAPKVVPSRWLQMPETVEEGSDELFDDDFQTGPGPLPLFSLGGILWRPYLNNMFWNLNSFDAAASFASETTSVSTTFPRGVFIGLAMCVLGYIVPMLVAIGATDYSQADWVDGFLGTVAVDIGGEWLGVWTVFAAGISNLALFEAEMSSDAFQLMGMAERGHIPNIFTRRSKYGTPTFGIIFNTVVIIVFGCADFGQLLQLLNSVYAMALLMEYAAFVKLRLYHKELQRPYRIPVPDWAAVLIVIPPTVGILFVFATSNWDVYIFCAGALLFSYLLSKFADVASSRGWAAYESKGNKFNMYEKPHGDVDDTTEPTEGMSHLTLLNGQSSNTANTDQEWEYSNEDAAFEGEMT